MTFYGHFSNVKNLKKVCPTFNIQIWYEVPRSIGYIMGPFLVVCDTLKGPLQAIKLAGWFFDTFVTAERAPGIDIFDQESVQRYGLGYSTYSGLDFKICIQCSIWWAVKCQFFETLTYQKVHEIFEW